MNNDFDRYINDTPTPTDYKRMAADYARKQRDEYRRSVIKSAIAITILFLTFLILVA